MRLRISQIAIKESIEHWNCVIRIEFGAYSSCQPYDTYKWWNPYVLFITTFSHRHRWTWSFLLLLGFFFFSPQIIEKGNILLDIRKEKQRWCEWATWHVLLSTFFAKSSVFAHTWEEIDVSVKAFITLWWRWIITICNILMAASQWTGVEANTIDSFNFNVHDSAIFSTVLLQEIGMTEFTRIHVCLASFVRFKQKWTEQKATPR